MTDPTLEPPAHVTPTALDRIERRQDDLRRMQEEISTLKNRRQDDLRVASQRLTDATVAHLKEINNLTSKHQRANGKAEADRLDSIRRVDREDVDKAAAQALSAIQTLATTTSTTAETLRTQVATTALAAQNQLAVITGEINKRLSALELSLSEGKGKQLVSDPQTERLAEAVQALVRNADNRGGQREGLGLAWYVIGGVVAILGTLVLIGGALVGLVLFLGRSSGPPIYVPAPAGTTLPTAPPQSVPR